MPTREEGVWTAKMERLHGKAEFFLESDDFTHDVRLLISGDFETDSQAWIYACEIARRLNSVPVVTDSADMVQRHGGRV